MTEDQKANHRSATIRSSINQLIEEIRSLGVRREYSLAITKLEEARMWAEAGIKGGLD